MLPMAVCTYNSSLTKAESWDAENRLHGFGHGHGVAVVIKMAEHPRVRVRACLKDCELRRSADVDAEAMETEFHTDTGEETGGLTGFVRNLGTRIRHRAVDWGDPGWG